MAFLQFFAVLFAAYSLCGVAYLARLYWPLVTARLAWLIAPLCVLVFWPLVLWAEVEHEIRDRLRPRARVIPSRGYLSAVADLTAERQRRGRA